MKRRRKREPVHVAMPFTELPLRARCGAGPGVVMTLNPKRSTCLACKRPRRQRGCHAPTKGPTLCYPRAA